MPSLSRRSLLLGLVPLAAGSLMGKSPDLDAVAGPVLLDRQIIPLDADIMRFEVVSPTSGKLSLRTEAEVYWLYGVDVLHSKGFRQVISVGWRLLPGKELEIGDATSWTGPVQVQFQYAYLPLDSALAAVELWASKPPMDLAA